MDHSDEERAFEALSAELSRTDQGWQRRWRLAHGLLASCSPSWARLAASFMLLMVDAALLVVMVASGQRGVLVGVAAVFAVGMQQLGRSTWPQPLAAARVRVKRDHLRRRDQPRGRSSDRRGL